MIKIGIYYVKPKDEEELLKKVKEVLNEKQEFKREILEWDKVAEKYIESFNEVI